MTEPAFDIAIDDLGDKGDGIAHHAGRTLFVPYTLPGEQIRVRESADGQRPRLVRVLTEAPERCKPLCPHFGTCGGCRLQHMTFPFMKAWKEACLDKGLAENGIEPRERVPMLVSPPAARRRARLAARHTRDGIILGFNQERSEQIVDLVACAVLHPSLEAFLPKLRADLPLWLPKNATCDIQLTLLPDGLDMLLIGGPALDLDTRLALAMLADKLDIAQLSWRKWDRSHIEPLALRRPLSVTFGKTSVPFPAGSFLQATEAGEQALLSFAKEAVGTVRSIADLFCGLGGFGLSMERARAHLFIDNDGPALDALARALKGRVKSRIERLNLFSHPPAVADLDSYEAILFDPPRGGAKAVAQRLAESHVKTVVAISCDPASFVRDARILLNAGFTCQRLQAVDQFLWSPHLELAAHFVR